MMPKLPVPPGSLWVLPVGGTQMSMAERKRRISHATSLLPAWLQRWVGYIAPPPPSGKFLLLYRDLQRYEELSLPFVSAELEQ